MDARVPGGAGTPRWVLDQYHGVYVADGTGFAVEGIGAEVSKEEALVTDERFIKLAPFRPSG